MTNDANNSLKQTESVDWQTLIISISVILLLSTLLFLFPERGNRGIEIAFQFLTHRLGWLYIGFGILTLLFLIGLALSPYRNIQLGPKGEPPRYSALTWAGMLFSTGIGTALISPFERCRFHCHRATATCAAPPALGTCLYMFRWWVVDVACIAGNSVNFCAIALILISFDASWSARSNAPKYCHPNHCHLSPHLMLYRFREIFNIKLHVSLFARNSVNTDPMLTISP